jgi:hypothetical protein
MSPRANLKEVPMIASRKQIVLPDPGPIEDRIREMIDHTAIVRGKMSPAGKMTVEYTISVPGHTTATVDIDAEEYYQSLKLEAEIGIRRVRMLEADHRSAAGQRGVA